MQKVMDILPKMVNSLGIDKKYKVHLIIFYWNKIVGDDIASQSTPIEVEYGVLFIAVNNSVWCHHLAMMKADILYKINQFIGEPLIRDLKFKNYLASKPKNDVIEEEINTFNKQIKTVKLDNKELKQIEEKCKIITDDNLKGRINHLYKKHLLLEKVKLKNKWHKCSCCEALCPEKDIYCNICSVNKRHEKLAQIRNELINVPWATYAEINKYIPCTSQEYIDAKVTLLNKISGSIAKDDDDSIDVKTLTMLFTGARHDKVDRRLIQKTLAKFRRKNYVSTFRG